MKLRANIKSSVADIRQRINKKKTLSIVILLLLLVFFASSYYFFTNKNKENKQQPSQSIVDEDPPEGSGGDPNVLVDNHRNAIEAWKIGDQDRAKEYAQKVIDENKNLTYKQMDELPGQQSMVIDSYAIIEGSY